MTANDASSDTPRPAGLLRRWLFTWRVVLLLAGALLTLVVLFYAEEDWRGWHAWSTYRRSLEAQGERLDLKAFIPPPVPDEQNFAAIPFIRSWFDRSNGDPWSDDYEQAAGEVASANEGEGRRQFIDLAAWARAFDPNWTGASHRKPQPDAAARDRESRAQAAAVVLRGLQTSAEHLAQLQAASQRPWARYPVVYNLDSLWSILLPHLAKVKQACQRLQLRACAELAAGQSSRALDDVQLMLYLADSAKTEPFLISHLVRIACVQIAIQPIWEGLLERRWSEAALETLETRLQQLNFVADAQAALQAEQAAGICTIEIIRRKGLSELVVILNSGSDSLSPASKALLNLLGVVIPRGWYYQEELNYCKLRHLLTGASIDAARMRVSPEQVAANNLALHRAVASGSGLPARVVRAILHHYFVSGALLPALNRVSERAAAVQTAVNQAVLGYALERYRLARGQFPEKLDALAPKFLAQLPQDVITGKPYKYHRTGAGQFTLYSVGWDQKDDNGEPGRALFDENWGDWVWQ
jgi:hypothetical protein